MVGVPLVWGELTGEAFVDWAAVAGRELVPTLVGM